MLFNMTRPHLRQIGASPREISNTKPLVTPVEVTLMPSSTPTSSITPTATSSATVTITPTPTNTPTVTSVPPRGAIEFVFDLSYSMNIAVPALGGRTFYSLTVETLLNRDFNLIDTPVDAVGLRTFGDSGCAEQERYTLPQIRPATGKGVTVLEEIQRLRPSSNNQASRSAIMAVSRWASVDVDNVAITGEKRTVIIYSDGIDNCFNRMIPETNDAEQAAKELELVGEWALEFEESIKNAQQREQINIQAYFFVYLLETDEMPLYCRYIIDIKPENMYCTPIRIPESADVEELIQQGIQDLLNIYCSGHNILCPTPTIAPSTVTATPTLPGTFTVTPTPTLTPLPTLTPTATKPVILLTHKTPTPATPLSTPNNTMAVSIVLVSLVGIVLLAIIIVVIIVPFVIGLTLYTINTKDDL